MHFWRLMGSAVPTLGNVLGLGEAQQLRASFPPTLNLWLYMTPLLSVYELKETDQSWTNVPVLYYTRIQSRVWVMCSNLKWQKQFFLLVCCWCTVHCWQTSSTIKIFENAKYYIHTFLEAVPYKLIENELSKCLWFVHLNKWKCIHTKCFNGRRNALDGSILRLTVDGEQTATVILHSCMVWPDDTAANVTFVTPQTSPEFFTFNTL